ncbi:MAG: hypothetical protein IK093_11790 [Ruminiclostridium sp.]|nr:hypothetical protein [Ruminiclostridium sp.]
MSYFDPNRGMFHFAFVQENDKYCTEGGVMIKCVPFLYSLLKNLRRNHPMLSFFHVTHTGGTGSNFKLTYTGFTPPSPSPQPQQNDLFSMFRNKQKPDEGPAAAHRGIFSRETVNGMENVMGSYVLSSMEQHGDSVCMITADAFCEIKDSETIQRLIALSSVNRKSGRAQLFVILFPINRDISEYFTDRNSILRSPELFPETDRLFREQGSRNFLLYDELAKLYGERFAVFDTRSPDNVSNMLKRVEVITDGVYRPADPERTPGYISWKLYTAPEKIFGRDKAFSTDTLEEIILKDGSIAAELLSPAPDTGYPELRKIKNSLWQNSQDFSDCGEQLLRLYDALLSADIRESLRSDFLTAALSFRKTLCDNADFTYLFRYYFSRFVSNAEKALENTQPELLAAAAECIIFFAKTRASLVANDYRTEEMRCCCEAYDLLYELYEKKCSGETLPAQSTQKKLFSFGASGASSGIDGDITKLRTKIHKLSGGVKNIDSIKNEIEEIRLKYADI